jgi:hypothetical protein
MKLSNESVAPALVKFEFSAQRAKGYSFFIWDQQEISAKHFILVEKFLNTFLFFQTRGGLTSINTMSKLSAQSFAASNKSSDILFILNPNYLLSNENLVDTALGFLREYTTVAVKNSGDGQCVLFALQRDRLNEVLHLWKRGLSFYTLQSIADKTVERNCSHDLLNLNKNQTDEFIDAETYLQEHFSSVFPATFLLNTEAYQIPPHLVEKKFDTFCGVASGFKLNFLFSKLADKSVQNSISYFDINPDSIKLKKEMISTWAGKDFLNWVETNNILTKFCTAPQNRDEIELLWNREKDLWGGEKNFADEWNYFRTQKINFHIGDILKNPQLMVPQMRGNGILFWISNVWNNEHVFNSYGADNVPSKYLDWLNTFNREGLHNASLFQSKIFLRNEDFVGNGLTVAESIQAMRERITL